MSASLETIRQLREATSCGVIDCKKALEETGGNIEKAKELLKQRGLELAAKKAGRVAKEGRVEVYVHPGNKLVAIVEVSCETDFVARNEDFIRFSKDVAMQIGAMAPRYIKEADIPEDVLASIEDRKAYVKEKCLMNQAFIKDSSKTIQDYLNEVIARIGENIFVNRFNRYKVGEGE
ncbi:MAG: elongation factor Ts [Candidatus Omnitrophota bacterium]